jgi:hypothetical protein
MTRRELVLFGLVIVLSGVILALLCIYNADVVQELVGRAVPVSPLVPPPTRDDIPEFEDAFPLDAGEAEEDRWVAVDSLDQILGLWRSVDGLVTVKVASRSLAEASDGARYWVQPYRLTVTEVDRDELVCGVRDRLQWVDATDMPSRQGLCKKSTAGQLESLCIYLLRRPGFEELRLLLGTGEDLDLVPVP